MAEINERQRKEKISLYLIRDNTLDDEKFIKFEKVQVPAANLEMPDDVKATLYIKKNPRDTLPSWTKFLTNDQNLSNTVFYPPKSLSAVVVVRANKNIFVLSFGMGFHLFKSHYIERDFGLRVTLNSVEPEQLRSIDKSNFSENPLHSRTQSTKAVDAFELLIDSESDLMYAITGTSKIKEFGSIVTGRDALVFNTNKEFKQIVPILTKAITLYKSKLPKEFSWFDDIKRVKSPDLVNSLVTELIQKLNKNKLSDVWLGEQGIVDWEEQVGYSFYLRGNFVIHETLNIEDLLKYLKDCGRDISYENLEKQNIHIIGPDHKSVQSWRAYNCLYAELKYEDKIYILRAGVWYEIETNFLKVINEYIAKIPLYNKKLPIYDCMTEKEYNNKFKKIVGYEHMDAKNISYGGGQSKIEFCDVIYNKSEWIHVKYYRGSSCLSHLFSQGQVASETFIKEEAFREKLNDKLPPKLQIKDVTIKPNASNYTIIFAIATNKNIPEELPFFSKITLKNAFKNLDALGFKVNLLSIDIDPIILTKKKNKPSKNKKQTTARP
ncbi:TIGR04141 family sporadically distributed protein [Kangiella sp. HZ709]|uniref:TIGR04141 family sporadically distributed protein n=1 Tax=Kangiella sp. HZ709 TaxID=2666328 RepID=UPI0012B01E24|nr:TIGR04141 family sporadically distributed protein [Kangiella sp. HZ709]MRX26588.1 sporadically distributed protein, TIGR04141 family [Kangiella sp. HZ709]